jgi:hypothetical protein
MDLSRCNAVLGHIRNPAFRFHAHQDAGGEVPYLQVVCGEGTCNVVASRSRGRTANGCCRPT